MHAWRTWMLSTLAASALAVASPPPAFATPDEVVAKHGELVRSLLPTVVNIIGHMAISAPTPGPVTAAQSKTNDIFQIRTSNGSGFIVDPDGVIATNWHVVDGAYEIFVTFSDGTRAKAEVLNAARIVDIALLKVTLPHKLPSTEWGDSSKVQIGDAVLAVGNPLGVGQSVTSGIVSAVNRNINDTPYDDFIQTDAPINHGNSGGPLFDMDGKVIGINTALISNTASSAGLGFAIPSNDAGMVIERLMKYGWMRPSFVGMKVQQLTPEMSMALGLDDSHASIVANVIEGGPAAKAGMKVGDVVMTFNGRAPLDERDLLRSIAAATPNEAATIGVLRAGQMVDLQVTLQEWPRALWDQRDAPIKVAEPKWNIAKDMGLKLRPLTPDLRSQNNIAANVPGLLITSMTPDADAGRRGVVVGDVVQQVGGAPVNSAADFQREVDKMRADGKTYGLFLMLQKAAREPGAKSPGTKWLALRVAD